MEGGVQGEEERQWSSCLCSQNCLYFQIELLDEVVISDRSSASQVSYPDDTVTE